MSSGNILFLTFYLTTIIGLAGYFLRQKGIKKQELDYPKDWNSFQLSCRINDEVEILRLGTELIYNKHLKLDHLNEILRIASEKKVLNSKFEKLEEDAYAKWIHYTKGTGSVI